MDNPATTTVYSSLTSLVCLRQSHMNLCEAGTSKRDFRSGRARYVPSCRPGTKGLLRMKLESEPPRTVFVIDDDQAILEVLGLLLRRRNFTVVVANSLESAAEMWRMNRDQISAVISDKCLKVGEDCSPFLRQIHEERPELPLIVMSGYSQDESEPFMAEWEGMRYLTKPFDPSELFRALDSVPTG